MCNVHGSANLVLASGIGACKLVRGGLQGLGSWTNGYVLNYARGHALHLFFRILYLEMMPGTNLQHQLPQYIFYHQFKFSDHPLMLANSNGPQKPKLQYLEQASKFFSSRYCLTQPPIARSLHCIAPGFNLAAW